jgi:CheY-like chemotaxis protein
MAGLIEGRADRARWGLQGFLRGVTVLVVEDDADVRDAVGLLMESFGARLLLAVDGADALAQLDASSPDLILSDLAMPNLNGSMLIQHVRRDAIQAHLPAMAMSAFVDPADCARTIREGFDAHVGKPFDEAALWSALGRLMSRRPALFKRQRERLRRDAARARMKARSCQARAAWALRKSNELARGDDSPRMIPADGRAAA